MNQYKVPKKQWMKWSKKARETFNEIYGFGLKNKWAMQHPKQGPLSPEFWKTTCWNFAWLAADTVDEILPSQMESIVHTDDVVKKVA